MLTRTLRALFVPEGLLLLLALAIVHWGSSHPGAAPIVRLAPVVVLVAGLLLGWRFQRGRLLVALAGLALADRAMIWLAPPETVEPHAGPAIVRAIALLLPASLALLSFLPERAPRSAEGWRRLTVLALEAALVLVVWMLSAAYPERVLALLDARLLPVGMPAWLPIGQPAALAALLALAALVLRTVQRRDAESRGFLWAAIACVIAVCAGPAEGRATLYLAAAGLVLAATAVESAYAMAYHDELTGLPARRALNEALQEVGGTWTVAMVDVDHFKKFNDTHGHDVGDQVLRMVAGRLALVNGGGRAFRYGGEEFAVLFPGKTAGESAPHLESLRASVEGATFTQRAKDRPTRKPKVARPRAASARPLAVTVSIGAAQARGASAPGEVVKAADRALYRAKEAGRNRVVL